jgi:hypothetical protein
VTLVAVTTLLVPYGQHAWSWVAGPVAALVVWAIDRLAELPCEPAPARAGRELSREPEPVD